MNKAIMYIGNFLFPDGNASGKRVYGNACIFRDLGYEVFCYGFSKNEFISNNNTNGIHYRATPYIKGIRRLECNKPFKQIRDYYKEVCKKGYKLDAIIMYGSVASTTLNLKLLKWGHNHSIDVYYDHVDIFPTPQKKPIFRYLMKLHENKMLDKKVFPKCDGIIAISSYIENEHKDYCKTVVIPPVVEKMRTRDIVFDDNEKIEFVYAGTISDKNREIDEWKDRIDLIITAFYDLFKAGNKKVHLNILGFTSEEFIGMLPQRYKADFKIKIDRLNQMVSFYGLCDSETTLSKIQKSDFSILLRDKKITTDAGFPTKVSESIVCGIPVIANATSDIEKYVKDEYNGFIIDKSKLSEKIKNICNMKSDAINQMKKNCGETMCFIYTEYIEKMKEFMGTDYDN